VGGIYQTLGTFHSNFIVRKFSIYQGRYHRNLYIPILFTFIQYIMEKPSNDFDHAFSERSLREIPRSFFLFPIILMKMIYHFIIKAPLIQASL